MTSPAFTHRLSSPYSAIQILASIAVFAINERKYSARYQAAVAGEVAGN